MLYGYLGDIAFNKIAYEYILANASKRENANFLGNNLPQFLQASNQCKHTPEIFELASLEVAINKAFVAPETNFATSSEFIDSKKQTIKIKFVESAQFLLFNQNTTSIWAALKCGEKPPRPHSLEAPQNVLVWRQRGTSRFRIFGDEEATLFQLFANKASLKSAAKSLAPKIGQELALQRTTTYLRGWLEAELIAAPV